MLKTVLGAEYTFGAKSPSQHLQPRNMLLLGPCLDGGKPDASVPAADQLCAPSVVPLGNNVHA